MKQVRFGKFELAFLQLNGVIFTKINVDFGHVALRFQQIGALVWKPGTCSHFGGYLVDRIIMPKTPVLFFFAEPLHMAQKC